METGAVLLVTQFLMTLRTEPLEARLPGRYDEDGTKKNHDKTADEGLQMFDPELRSANRGLHSPRDRRQARQRCQPAGDPYQHPPMSRRLFRYPLGHNLECAVYISPLRTA